MNQKKILTVLVSGALLFTAGALPVTAAETVGQKQPAVSDFVKPGAAGVRKIGVSGTDGKGVQDAVESLKRIARLEKKVGKAAAGLTKTKEEVSAAKEAQKEAVIYAEPVEVTPENTYIPEVYTAPAASADILYAEPLYQDPVYTDAAAETVAAEMLQDESLYTETSPDTAEYAAPAYDTGYEEELLYNDASYTEDTSYSDVYYEEPSDDTGYETPVYEETVYEDPYAYDVYDTGDGYDDGTAGVSVSDSDLDLLASIIYCEAGGESYDGQVAVGAVVLNRMASSLYPDDMTDVIYQSGQFTPAMTGWLDQVRASGVPDYCYEAAQAALNGENPVGDCLYFHAGGGDGLTIGNQTFY